MPFSEFSQHQIQATVQLNYTMALSIISNYSQTS